MTTKTYEYRSGGSLWGLVLILVGLAFLGDNLGWFSFDVWEVLWPTVIIIIGLQLLLRRGRRVEITPAAAIPPPPPPASPPPPPPPVTSAPRAGGIGTDKINESHVMGEMDLLVDSQAFRGGSASTVFGDLRIDFAGANLADGEQVLSLNTVFGEIRVSVPASWEYSIEATTVFGEVEASGKRRGGVFSNVVSATVGYADAPRRLRIHASTVFGEVRVVTR